MSKLTLTTALLFVMSLSMQAQDLWTLERCLTHAKENNLQLQQTEVNLKIAEHTLHASRMGRLPTLNFGTNYGINWGRAIDPSTNNFINQRINFNSYNLNLGLPLYAGGSINARIKGSQADVMAAKSDLISQEVQQLNSLSETYLMALMASDQLEAARKTKAVTETQLKRMTQLILTGTAADNERFNLEAQLARDEQTIIAAENNLQAQLLALKALLNLPPNSDITLEKPELILPEEGALAAYQFAAVYETNYQRAPQVQAAQARAEGAQYDIKIARAFMLPSISAFGGLNTNYSSAGRRLVGFSPVTIEQEVSFMGQSATIGFQQFEPVLEDNPFFDQLEDNFGQSMGVSLNIPIFNQRQNYVNVQQAKLRQQAAQLQYEQAKQAFGTQVQQSIAQAQAAQARYQAALIGVEAQRLAFSNAEKRFELGASNSIDLTTAKINLERSELELIQAKYEYLYRFKVLEWISTDLTQPIRFF